jgi:putative ABC transport system substrate-binding protein
MRRVLSAIGLIIVALVVDSSTAAAQQPGRVYKIAWLHPGFAAGVPPPFEKWTGMGGAFRDALRERGFVVGKNLIVDFRTAQGDASRLPALADALVATQPDVLVTFATLSTVEAMRATKTIPIVFVAGNPVERGIVKSLVDHGGNVTGQTGNLLSFAKVWQLLRDAAPAPRRAGFVAYAPNSWAQDRSPEYRAKRMATLGSESAQVGFELVDLGVDRLDELEPKVAALANGGEAALFLSSDPTLLSWRAEIMSMAMRYRLPTACAGGVGWEGCLITYAADQPEIGRRTAAQVVKILNGTKPADIPIEQPTKFKLIVNAKTAKELGLTLPPSMLVMADEVIE